MSWSRKRNAREVFCKHSAIISRGSIRPGPRSYPRQHDTARSLTRVVWAVLSSYRAIPTALLRLPCLVTQDLWRLCEPRLYEVSRAAQATETMAARMDSFYNQRLGEIALRAVW